MQERYVLQWHITHRCNLKCTHCYQEEYDAHMSEDDFYNALEKYKHFLKEYNFRGQINLTGGEPLMHPKFFSFADAIRKKEIPFSILTNGTLIDNEVAKRISDLKPIFVQVSLDGTEETHDKIRGTGNFQKAINGIRNLKKYKIRVLVSFTAQKQNIQDFSKLAAICRKNKVDKLWWDRVVTYSKKDEERQALSTEEFREMVQNSHRLRKKYRHMNGSSLVDNGRALQFLGTKDCIPGYYCSAGKRLIVFLADGSVMPCRRLPFIVGNILKTKLDDIVYKNQVMRQIASFSVPDECCMCEYVLKCRGGAKCITYAQYGDMFRKDVNCFMEQNHGKR